jgi:uncharacterized membrane protein YeaQ/YmgE (transglycosylase-associated protein family)
MGILAWIVFGALVGWIASMIMKKSSQMGAFANIVVGILGAFIGGLIMSLIGGWDITGFNLRSFLVALLGAIILLAIVNVVKRGKASA